MTTTKLPSTATKRILSITNHLKDSANLTDDKANTEVSVPYKFQGWLGLDKESNKGNMVWNEYEPKTWTEDDVDIKIAFCGVCGSDIHTLRNGWKVTVYPCCVGHEITGTAVKVGQNVTHIKLGDRCGVGAQSGSCLRPDCEECSLGDESYCKHFIETYNGKYPDGSRSFGGYANYCRVPAHFVIKIPDALKLAEAAPMLCGGVTSWSALVKNGAGPGKSIGIVGIGGLGHFGLLWAKGLGCDKVVAISRSGTKRGDAMKMGADDFIATDEDKDWNRKHGRSLDLIVSTVSGPKMPLSKYLHLLKTNGQFIQVGAPEEKFPAFNAFALIQKNVKIGGSSIGSPREISEMLEFAAKNDIHPWIEERPLKDANRAIIDMENGDARYRYVLVNEDHARELKV